MIELFFTRTLCGRAFGLGCLLISLLASPAQAAPLVSNGGFESPPPGSLDGWNVQGFVVCVSDPLFAHTGDGSAAFYPFIADPSVLSQDIATVVGHQYLVQFFAASGNTPFNSAFDASFAGTTLATASTLTSSYTAYSFLATATSNLTTLSFTTHFGLITPDIVLLDDVSVTDTAPEVDAKSALAPLALALGLLLLDKRRL